MSGLRNLHLSPNYKWYVVGMLWFMAFFNYADRMALAGVLPLLETDMGLDKVQQGMLGSAFAWCYGLAAPFAGYLVDRIPRKTAIIWGLQIWSIVCIATASARTYPQLLFFRAAEGIGEAAYFPASMSLLSDYHGKETRSRAMSLHQTSVYLGTIAGAFFAAWIGQEYGWRWSFVIFGALGVVLGIVLRNLLHEPERGASEEVKPSAKESSARLSLADLSPTLLLAMGGFCCANFVAVVLMSWMTTHLFKQFDLNLAVAGLSATAPIMLASMFAAPFGGWLADKLALKSAGGRMTVQMVGGAPRRTRFSGGHNEHGGLAHRRGACPGYHRLFRRGIRPWPSYRIFICCLPHGRFALAHWCALFRQA
jgi:predicted MFS family arabinose efflux permease